ncbi:MAG: DUF7901 domain-containing protein, partial [Planctomycetota bacterium]
MIKEYAVKEWMDADYDAGPPKWYDDWSVSDPVNIDGYANEIWMRMLGHSIWTSSTVPSSTVSIHLHGDNNDGVADVLVDGILAASIDMGTSPGTENALIIVKDLANITHHIRVNDLGIGPSNLGRDIATMGAAALEKKIKWSQPPIPTVPQNLYYGWNEVSDYNGPQIVADDWECANNDPVTDIHWWGSYVGWTDFDPPLIPESFHITFWNDIPDPDPTDPDTFSHPNEVVWEIDCFNFNWHFVGYDYDPITNCFETCYFFEQYLTEAEYFYQAPSPDGTPSIYWISIAANYPDGSIVDHPWGWKTRPHWFNDDAVIIRKPTMPHIGDKYQDGKPIYWPDPTRSWDMAFELTARPVEEYTKWSQPPKYPPQGGPCYWGWDEFSQFASTRWIVADDWVCNTDDPVKDIHWWGSYIGWNDENPPPDAPDRFHIGIWTDVPVGPIDNFSHPGQMIWEWIVPRSVLLENYDGCDEHPLVPPPGLESCFYYEFKIPQSEWFYQEFDPLGNPNIYWLSISAVYINDPIYPWGWKTRLRDTDSQAPDDAVRIFDPTAPAPGIMYISGEPIFWPDVENSWDTAFELTSTRFGDNYTKWSQPPRPYTPEAYDGWNEESIYNGQTIAADDWYCDTDDPVTDIHWWGSFIGWSCEEPPEMPESFHIAIWTDVPSTPGTSDFSHPNEVIWETTCNNFTYVFDGWDIDPRNPDAPPETCFKFEQDLPEEEWFHQQPGGNIYWISIAANYPVGTSPLYPWGWKTRLRDLNSLAPDDAVRIIIPTNPVLGSSYINGQPIFWPTEEESWDLAFELTTKEKPPKPPVPHLKWSQPPIEINPPGQGEGFQLYAVTFQATDQLLSVNSNTGAGALIGNMSTLTPFGLSDRGTELYTFDSGDANSIVKIDPTTGNTLQKIAINPGTVTGEGGLAFRSNGIGYLTSAMGNAGDLWNFDITVPSSTYIGAFSPSMDGLDFNGSDVLYGLKQSYSVPPSAYELYTINQATGAATLVGSTGVIATGSVGGLTFAPDGTLYAAINDSLYTLNPGTGAATLVGPIGFSGVCGLTAVAVTVANEPTLPIYSGWDEISYIDQIDTTRDPFVADDFRCLGSMPVTSIHWWGSYYGLVEPGTAPLVKPIGWKIGFWSNVPESADTDYSYPEKMLWEVKVPADRVEVEEVGTDFYHHYYPNDVAYQYTLHLVGPNEVFWQGDYLNDTKDDV